MTRPSPRPPITTRYELLELSRNEARTVFFALVRELTAGRGSKYALYAFAQSVVRRFEASSISRNRGGFEVPFLPNFGVVHYTSSLSRCSLVYDDSSRDDLLRLEADDYEILVADGNMRLSARSLVLDGNILRQLSFLATKYSRTTIFHIDTDQLVSHIRQILNVIDRLETSAGVNTTTERHYVTELRKAIGKFDTAYQRLHITTADNVRLPRLAAEVHDVLMELLKVTRTIT